MRSIEVDFDIHQLIEVERRGFDETPNDVLRRLLGLSEDADPIPSEPEQGGPARSNTGRTSEVRKGEVRVAGRVFRHRSASEAMVIVLRELAKADGGLLERRYRHHQNRGRKRCHIARTVDDLYPGRPSLYKYHEELPGGWLVGTNISNVQKQRVLLMVAECAGVEAGTDIVVPALSLPALDGTEGQLERGALGIPPRRRR